MSRQLSIGKYRALQRATNKQGIFNILAMDHQDALRRAMKPDAPESVTDTELVNIKQDVVFSLLKNISGILLDPAWGLPQAIARQLPGSIGLLAELEKADYNMEPLPLHVEIRPGWSVGKIKRMGADGVKLFYYYDPANTDLRQAQDETIRQTVAECEKYDVPLYAEPIVTNATPDNRPQKVIDSAKLAQSLGADILKLEFPVDVHHQPEPESWRSACEELSASVEIPWVLLSAGVAFETFCQQVEIACQSGASGFIVGRAVWGDVCGIQNRDDRITWLNTIGQERIQRLTAITAQHATSWQEFYQTGEITTLWYRNYQDIE